MGRESIVEEIERLKLEVKRLKSKGNWLKSELKHVERSTPLKSEPEQKQTGNRTRSESTVEGDDLVDMKSERKHVERGKQLESDVGTSKITYDIVPDRKLSESIVEGGKGLKSEVKQLKLEVKRLKLKVKRLKSELKHVKRSTRLKSEPEQIQIQTRGRSRSPFDAIGPPPPIPGRPGRSGGLHPVSITVGNRPFLIELSKLALEMYNDGNNQDPHFEFDELVKSTVGFCAGRKYYITFKAKRSSDASSTIFHGIVWRRLDGSSEARSCDIKT